MQDFSWIRHRGGGYRLEDSVELSSYDFPSDLRQAPAGGSGPPVETMPEQAYTAQRSEHVAKRPSDNQPKPVRWVGSSKEDLKEFPEEVRRRAGGALWDAQLGRRAPYAKPLKGFHGASVLEIVDDFDGDTYRAVYTVRFAGAVYVLHAFQKKSKRGIATPKVELDLIERRLKRAKEDYERWSRSQKTRLA